MTEPRPEIGYIGLGIMGQPMAKNLLDAGYPLTVWNRTASKADALVAAGAERAESPADLAGRDCSIVFINVTATADVEQVVFGEQGLVDALGPDSIIVDHSTISPVATQAIASKLRDRGIDWVDAPVSGGDIGAIAGTLSIMVGGAEEAVTRVRPMLEVVGSSVVHLGGSGMGQVCKACNQTAGMVALLGVCEALALAKQSGLDMSKMIEVVGGGAASSWQLLNLGPKIVKGDDEPGFMIDLVVKDLQIVLESAEATGLTLNSVKEATKLFEQLQAQGDGALGTQAIAKAYEQAGGFRFD